MKKEAVRVVPWRDGSRFDVRHWGKHITSRNTQAEAETVATELRKKLDRQRFLREEKRRERNYQPPPPPKPEDIDTWREDGRDPNQPEYHWCNVYPNDGSPMRKEYHRIPPGCSSHWTHKYRTGWRQVGYGPERKVEVPPSLPMLPLAESIKCKPPFSSSAIDSNADSNPVPALSATGPITEPSGPDAPPPPPAEVSAAPIRTSSSPFLNELTSEGRHKVKAELWEQL